MAPITSDPYEDTRSGKEKGADYRSAVASAATLVAVILARRKLALTRGFSKDILSAGLEKESRFLKYIASNAKKAVGVKIDKSYRQAALDKLEDVVVGARDMFKDLFRTLPTGEEQYDISLNFLEKYLKHDKTAFPPWKDLGVSGGFWKQMVWGPLVTPFKGGTTLGIIGRKGVPNVVGKHGAMIIGSDLYFLKSPKKALRYGPFEDYRIRGVHASIVDTMGTHLERARRGVTRSINPRDTESFVRRVELDPKSIYDVEARDFYKSEYFARFLPGYGDIRGKTAAELRVIAQKEYLARYGGDDPRAGENYFHNKFTGKEEVVPTLSQFMKSHVSQYEGSTKKLLTYETKLRRSAAHTRRIIAKEAAKTKFAQLRFDAFKFGRKIGYSPEFASHGGGWFQEQERYLREKVGWNFKHPVTGEVLPVTPRRYNIAQRTLGSNWNGIEGPWYISGKGDSVKRWLHTLAGGSFHRVGEKVFGFGMSTRGNVATDFIRDLFGSRPGSYSDMWIRGISQTAKMVGLGMGAVFTYKFINYLSRQTLGWGPSDLAAGAYVQAREFQQSVLQHLGIVNAAKVAEKTLPGTINSPASHLARLLTPFIMANAFAKKGGTKGYALGLALGTATAMLTWGDLTQSPEELHRIFTGEQDIPLKKGRYWLLGKTPFFGGKISYWKKHWVPLLHSRYKFQPGGLWDSETEYWGQGSPLSPILAPLLTGKMWDAYHWEKKHYKDRPYPVTGEAFEPTMPFSWLANLTIGRILKPSTYMHKMYLGSEQGASTGVDRGVPLYSGLQMGYKDIPGIGISRAQSPYSLSHQVGIGAYTQVEQMGLLGFALNTINEKITGQTDFMGTQSVLQTSRRATGYERAYWDLEIGDPGAGLDEGLTEYFRRFLPHRRTSADEYNPIPNEMPSWMPGEDYFINFRQGDPYTKVELGESRLPGAGYEALNELHTGIPGSYDAVDRFMILANVAPYSNEYNQYKYLAKAMVKGDEYWSSKVRIAAEQREALNKEYEFLSLDTEGVPLPLKPISSIYRHGLAALTNFPNPLEMLPQASRVGILPTHINKWLPYKTAEGTYRDFRLYGSEYAMWGEPFQGFVFPFFKKLRGTFDQSYVPKNTEQRREIEEYFDKLKYVKYSNLAQVARNQGNSELARRFMNVSKNTMAMGPYHAGAAMKSIPKEEKPFFDSFSSEEGETRTRIMNMVPSYMREYYMTAWNQQDKENGIGPSYDVDYQKSRDLVAYFRNHQLPPQEWIGWHPDVSLNQVKLRVVKNEAFDIHKSNLWDSNERQLARQPFTPVIENINAPSNDLTMLQNIMVSNMERFGLTNTKVFVSRTPASENSYKMKINVTRDRNEEHNKAMRSSLSMR